MSNVNVMSAQPMFGHAAVASSQPLASAVGINVLARGGTAADAAIAMGAMLAVTEPTSNGLGGDLVALYRPVEDGAGGPVKALLGIGASPELLRPCDFVQPGGEPPSPSAGVTVTVPGTVAAWFDLKQLYGNPDVPMADLLNPAIDAARNGFFVHRTTARLWKKTNEEILRETPYENVPEQGMLFRNIDLANTIEEIRDGGRDAFYGKHSRIARAIVDALHHRADAPFMTAKDLEQHRTQIVDPLSVQYHDRWTVYEPGAPTHGAVALLALNIIRLAMPRLGLEPGSRMDDADGGNDDGAAHKQQEKDQVDDYDDNNAIREHVMIDALRLAFREASIRIADGEAGERGTRDMAIDEGIAERLAAQITLESKCAVEYPGAGEDGVGNVWNGGTVQFCVIDRDGNAASMTQSNYQGFGTGIVPTRCGFTLQNRGLNFSVDDERHANYVAGGKRPYHTIMPGLMVHNDAGSDKGSSCVAFGVMGSFMQPQGHVRVVTGLVDRGMDPQTCLDMPRFRAAGPFSKIERACGGLDRDIVLVEDTTPDTVVQALRDRGHVVERTSRTDLFGRGHVCACDGTSGRVAAGADRRADGVSLVWQ